MNLVKGRKTDSDLLPPSKLSSRVCPTRFRNAAPMFRNKQVPPSRFPKHEMPTMHVCPLRLAMFISQKMCPNALCNGAFPCTRYCFPVVPSTLPSSTKVESYLWP
ncbi:hypothetical protein TRVL_06699 [Trypanosoma vivax]|nr:hypothetical protein TRVL_06699 [Trypanosoma vivax]